MKITTVLEKEGGLYEFTANLTPDQHRFLLEYAIQHLITRGLVPFDVVAVADGAVEGAIPVTDSEPSH